MGSNFCKKFPNCYGEETPVYPNMNTKETKGLEQQTTPNYDPAQILQENHALKEMLNHIENEIEINKIIKRKL